MSENNENEQCIEPEATEPKPEPTPAFKPAPVKKAPVRAAATKVAETHAPAFEALAKPVEEAKPVEQPKPALAPVAPAAPAKPKIGHFSRIQPAMLYPPFMAKLEKLVEACEKRGARYYAICGFRSADEQAALYAQGRTKPGKVVTNAKPYSSAHQFHCAVDFCRDADMNKEGLQPDWDIESYRILAEEAVKLGLEAAFNWKSFKEGPHIQLPLGKVGLSLDDLRRAYISGGQAGLYALLSRYNW